MLSDISLQSLVFASGHGLNSFPTYILVFTTSSCCLLSYMFLFLVESTFLVRHVTILRELFQNKYLIKAGNCFI